MVLERQDIEKYKISKSENVKKAHQNYIWPHNIKNTKNTE
jgi:hypothetical protein